MSIPDFNSDASPYDPSMPVNHNDDDAEILDNLIEPDATPPEPVEIPRVDIPPVPKVEIPPRITVRFLSVALDRGQTYQIALANPYRKKLIISGGGALHVTIASDPAMRDLNVPGNYYRGYVSHTGATIELETTEALWIAQHAGPVGQPQMIHVYEEIREEPGR